MTSFYSAEELAQIGFKSVGENVSISRKSSFYGVSRISIGSNVRIDDFCVISAGEGGIEIGNYVHIAVFSSMMGDGKIAMGDFSGLSSRVAVYSSNDDYRGNSLTNPTVPSEYTGVTHADVHIGKHVIIGSGSVILPGVTLHEGAAVGALSLVNHDCEEFYIYTGAPAKKKAERSRKLLKLEEELMDMIG